MGRTLAVNHRATGMNPAVAGRTELNESTALVWRLKPDVLTAQVPSGRGQNAACNCIMERMLT